MSIWKELAEPFPAEDVEWRLQTAGETNGRIWGICVPYVTARAIQERLDDVVGPANWKNEYSPGPSGGVQCGISIRVDGEWITKYDGAENTGKNDTEMAIKGGYSSAFKRAAVVWSLGRYLYGVSEMFAEISETGAHRGKTREGKPFRWDPPQLPAWALPRRLNRKEQEHAAILTYLRDAGSRAPEEVQKEIRSRWNEIRSNYATATGLAGKVEEATGEKPSIPVV